MMKREKPDNWASPAELAAALRSGEADVGPFKRTAKPRPAQSEPPVLTTSTVMADAWEKLAKEVLPLAITPEQEKWAKRLFFAGAMTLINSLIYSDVLDESNTDTATPQDVNRVDAIYHELNAFFSAIGQLQ